MDVTSKAKKPEKQRIPVASQCCEFAATGALLTQTDSPEKVHATLLSIGEVAKNTGLAVSTIRYYDEIGLIKAAGRVGGKRQFTHDVVARVLFIKRCQEVKFALEEIRVFVNGQRDDWQHLIEDKLDELKLQQSQLGDMITLLTKLRSCC